MNSQLWCIYFSIINLCVVINTTAQVGPSTPKSTKETKNLFLNLTKMKAGNFIFGQHHASYEQQKGKNNVLTSKISSDCFLLVGDHPGLFGFALHKGKTKDYFKKQVQEIYSQGGIIEYSWHVNNPANGKDVKNTADNPVQQIINKKGTAYKNWLDELDAIKIYFAALTDIKGNKIPILFRPFHENTGSWFWWGAEHCTANEFKKLWRFTIDYLREDNTQNSKNIPGVNNMLIAYSPSKPSIHLKESEERYPGDNYVDIMGFDNYAADSESLLSLTLNNLEWLAKFSSKHKKIAAITEIGIRKGIQNIAEENWFMDAFLKPLLAEASFKDIAYVMTWKNTNPENYWVPLPNQNNSKSFVDFYKNKHTYFLGDLPNMYQKPN